MFAKVKTMACWPQLPFRAATAGGQAVASPSALSIPAELSASGPGAGARAAGLRTEASCWFSIATGAGLGAGACCSPALGAGAGAGAGKTRAAKCWLHSFGVYSSGAKGTQ